MEKLTCNKAKQIDLVDYLASLGYEPLKIKQQDYWYLSPLRNENTPSFKVDRKLQMWFDHGLGKGGDLIDFGTLYFKCSISELLKKLSQQPLTAFSFHSQPSPTLAGEKKENETSRIIITDIRPLVGQSLLDYLASRNISVTVAQAHCREIDFLLYDKQHTVIGFKNNSAGFELRSADFKGSSSPKDITFIDAGINELTVFEGFFNYLSFETINQKQNGSLTNRQTNFLVLNSLSFFEKSKQLMEKHERVNLYLDKDKAGIKCTQQALNWNSNLYKDHSYSYGQHKDLNDWLTGKQAKIEHSQKLGRSFRL